MNQLKPGDLVYVISSPMLTDKRIAGLIGTVISGPVRLSLICHGGEDAYMVDFPSAPAAKGMGWVVARSMLRKISGPDVLDEFETADEVLASMLDRATPIPMRELN